LDLIPLPTPTNFIHKVGVSKTEFVKKTHERVKDQIQQQTERCRKQNNKGKKEVIFELGDWVWLYLSKERFPKQRKSKLNSWGDGLFQVVKRINNNANSLDLPSEFEVNATLCKWLDSFYSSINYKVDPPELRVSYFQEGGDDDKPLTKGPTIRAIS